MRNHCIVFCWFLVALVPPLAAEPVDDIRVLIDVSGSMKQNDPQNLRGSALRLLVGVLEKGSRAGVWTFGQYVNMRVPLGIVDDAWKLKAEKGAAKIHSRGLFTNIEAALEKATFDWKGVDPHYERSLILLTDGMVDVSKDERKSQASRRRILEKTLPRLRRAGIKVHTIALSKNADHALLKHLSLQTDGWNEQVEDADTLNRVFLRMFEKAAKPDGLPLEQNQFTVDASIEEMTLLIFRKGDTRPTRILRPDKSEFDQHTNPGNVRWHHEAAYDLVTVQRPRAGDWKLLADVDPDNRVMVVTNLKLKTTQLPSHINLGERFDFDVALLQDGKVITRKQFLDIIRVELNQNTGHKSHGEWILTDDGQGADPQAGDGHFTIELGDSLEAGQHEFVVLVDGMTFQREYQQRVMVYDKPVQVELQRIEEGDNLGVQITVVPNEGLVQLESLRLSALLIDSADESQSTTVPKTEQGWIATLDGLNHDVEYQVVIHVQGQNLRGNAIDQRLDPLAFNARVGQIKVAPDKPLDNESVPEKGGAMELQKEPSIEQESDGARDGDKGVNWWLVGAGLVVTNLLLLVGAFLIYRRIRKKSVDIDLDPDPDPDSA